VLTLPVGYLIGYSWGFGLDLGQHQTPMVLWLLLALMALAAFGMFRGATAGAFAMLSVSTGLLGGAYFFGHPTWTLPAAVFGLAGFLMVLPGLLRRDRFATLALTVMAVVAAAGLVLAGQELDEAAQNSGVASDTGLLRKFGDFASGRTDAQADVAAGRLRVLTYGDLTGASEHYERLLQERYGIELDSIGGCVVDQELVDYAAGYAEVSKAAIEARFGADVLDRTWETAQKRFLSQMAASFPDRTVHYVNTNPANPVIGDRSFAQGLLGAGIIPCGKVSSLP